jgi:hypothetical protein
MGMGDGRGRGLNAEIAKVTQRTRRRNGFEDEDFEHEDREEREGSDRRSSPHRE